MKTFTVVKTDGVTDTITNATSAVEKDDDSLDFYDAGGEQVAHYEPGTVEDWTEHADSAPEAVGSTPPADASSSPAAPAPASEPSTSGAPPEPPPAPADTTGSAAPSVDTPSDGALAELPNAGQGQPPAKNVENPGNTGAVNHLPDEAVAGGPTTPEQAAPEPTSGY